MPKFTLTGEHIDVLGNADGTKVTYEFYVERIDDVLEHVDLFLRGCGYNPTGTLDYITDDDSSEDEWTRVRREDAMAEGAEYHSKYYYDTERNK